MLIDDKQRGFYEKTLYLKFILAYIIFGFFGFMVVATFVSSMTMEHLKREKQMPCIRKQH